MKWDTAMQLPGCCSPCVSTVLIFLHTVRYWLMKPLSETQQIFQHRHLLLISKSGDLGPQTFLWLLDKNTVSKTAVLAGKNLAWGEAGGSGVQVGRGAGV